MDWTQAKALILASIGLGTDINTAKCEWSCGSTYRIVKVVDDCGIKVPIGRANEITISWSMLENCYQEMCKATGYNGTVFKSLYPKEHSTHSCHVHVVGQIFSRAGLAKVDSSGRYHFL